jgi:hypothetical protein
MSEKKELDCDGPYCLPIYKDGKLTGRVECPLDCTLCGIHGDTFIDAKAEEA